MEANQKFIPFNLPSIGEEEIDEVARTLRSGWLTSGPVTSRFEGEFSRYVNAPHALAVNSCTAGLHLALAAMGIGPGDEVISTPQTFCATINTILHVGATPVLGDVDADGNIDPASIASKVTGRTRAILPVHFAGLPCRMDEIWEIAERHNLKVIEDAAHAVGSEYRGARIGSIREGRSRGNHAVAFSFYATKNLTTGEGGMITAGDTGVFDRMRRLCLHGIDKQAWNRYSAAGSWYYEVLECGFKYNMSDIQSAIGIHQLRKQESFLARRAHLARLYTSLLTDVDEVETPREYAGSRHAWHLYVLRLRLDQLEIGRAEFLEELKRQGIGTSVHFIPVPLHPFFKEFASRPENDCPRVMSEYPRLLSLPLYPAMLDEDVHRVAKAVRRIVETSRKKQFVAAQAV